MDRARAPYTRIGLTPVAPALGAEISGIDLAQELDAETVGEIRRAFLDHLVIFFRGQVLSHEQFLAFARRFGRPIEYPFVKGIEGFPEIIEVLKRENETVNFGGIWHSDTAYLETPPMGTMLIAREVPPKGGDTLFANMYLACEILPADVKRRLETARAVNSSAKADVTRTREDRIRDAPGAEARKEYVAEHPVLRTHPETGRRALYVNVAHTLRFAGETEDQSRPLLEELFAHQVRPEFTCRFRWAPGSIAFWDNRATQHFPVNDYHGHRRRMHRITLAGDRPI
jgi:taurine dioxygenase